MIKISLYPLNGSGITNKGWDYIKSICDHIRESGRQIVSLMEYAIKFNEFCKNIETDRVFYIQYLNNHIRIYSIIDWDKRTSEYVPPIALIEATESI